MMDSKSLLQCRGLSKSYSGTSNQENRILEGVNLTLEKGQSMAIIGPSGCGKSTLLNIIGTLDQPDDGEVWFEGREITHLNDRESAQFRNVALGFVFQEHHLLPQCSVLENVCIPTLAPGSPLGKKEAVARAKHLLDQVGLSHRLLHRPAQLSGGERQRVAVARSLIHQPKLLLADEPTGSLDRSTATQLSDLLLNLVRTHHLGLIVVTHSEALASQMTTCFSLDGGRLTQKTEVAP